MNLYRVTNGYYGNQEVAVLVIDETKESAIERARLAFQNAVNRQEYRRERPDLFYESLEVETVFFDTSKPQCLAVIECSEINWMRNEE